jgi:hypothetical protein
MLAASGEVERPSKTDCVATKTQSLSAPQQRIGHAYTHGALDLSGDRQRAGVHGLRHGARWRRDLPRDRRHRSLYVSCWPKPESTRWSWLATTPDRCHSFSASCITAQSRERVAASSNPVAVRLRHSPPAHTAAATASSASPGRARRRNARARRCGAAAARR